MTGNEPTTPKEPGRAAESIGVGDRPIAMPVDDARPASARALAGMAPVVLFGLLGIGVLDLLTIPHRPTAVAHLVYFGSIGWAVSRLLKGAAATLGALDEQARAAERTSALMEGRLAAALERLAAALERAPAPGAPGPSPEEGDPKERLLAEFRAAVRAGQWAEAGERADAFAARYPGDPQAAPLAAALAEAKQAAAQDLRAKIDAAREVNDPGRVLDLRDLIAPLLAADALRALDRDLARWCMGTIQKRLRTGTMGVDVATLAARVAESLDTTTEGASLRAALPTLRRSAGLCARCARPYVGIEDACPECLHANGEMSMTKDEWATKDGRADEEDGGG